MEAWNIHKRAPTPRAPLCRRRPDIHPLRARDASHPAVFAEKLDVFVCAGAGMGLRGSGGRGAYIGEADMALLVCTACDEAGDQEVLV